VASSRCGAAAKSGESILGTFVPFPNRWLRFADAQIDSFVTHGINGTSDLTGNPFGFVVTIVLAHESAFASGPGAGASAAGTATNGASGGATPTKSHFQTPFLNH
jgi:hypothetical protein